MMTGKLFALKQWITLVEACEYLSNMLSEKVSVADLYRLAIARHLTISVHFVNSVYALIGKRRPVIDSDYKHLVGLDGKPFLFLRGIDCGDDSGERLFFGDEVSSISGVWDLTLLGAEHLDIEHALQREIDGPEVTDIALDGTFVSTTDGTFASLQNPMPGKSRFGTGKNDYYPAGGLPEDAQFVIRPAELIRFVASLSGQSAPLPEKPLDERERTTLLCIIGALAREAGLDLSQPMKAGAIVADHLAPELNLSGRTIGEKLKLVGEAMTRRTE